jgi:hypothetical protein
VSQHAAIITASRNNTLTDRNNPELTMLYETLKSLLKPLLPYIALALFGLYGVDLVLGADLNQYRDVFLALIISLILQPWIIYQLEN